MDEPLSPGVHVITANIANISAIIDGIVHLHATCVLHDGTLATFLPPLSHDTIYRWWQARLTEVTTGERHIIVHISNVKDRTTNPDLIAPWKSEGKDWPTMSIDPSPEREQAQAQQLEISGVVALETPFSQTGPFRALVVKLFVHPFHRRKGISRAMMARLETVALENGRWHLLLDTTVGSDAEGVYPRLGYERFGVLPEYGYHPLDGSLVDEVWFWKDLNKMKRLEETKESG